jgi:hypothetical protein
MAAVGIDKRSSPIRTEIAEPHERSNPRRRAPAAASDPLTTLGGLISAWTWNVRWRLRGIVP